MKKQSPTPPLRGKALARAVMNKIIAEPENWEQKIFGRCATFHCHGGWTIILAGEKIPTDCGVSAWELAQALLGISHEESINVFVVDRTLPELYAWTVKFCGSKRGLLPLPKTAKGKS